MIWRGVSLGMALALAVTAGLARDARAQSEDNAIVAEELRALFGSGEADTGSAAANAGIAAIRDIYVVRDFKPIWTRDAGPKTKARALLGELSISGVNGLSPAFYHVAEIEALMPSTKPADLARLDMLLSGAAAEFGSDLANGRVGPALAPADNAVEPLALTPADYVTRAEAAENFRDFAGVLLSEDYRYIRLIAKLSEFSRIEASGRWPAVDAGGAEIGPGRRDPRLKDIRTLLVLSGDLPRGKAGIGTLDDATAKALRSFQARHGLAETGIVDGATLAEMAVPVAERIRQIKVNLERRRWQNRDLGPDHVYINLADNSLKLVQHGRSERFVPVTGADAALPTFFGEILGVEIVGGDAALTVRSPFVDRIGGPSGVRAIAVSHADALGADLLAAQGQRGQAANALGAAKEPSTVTFAQPIPLFVTFVTAWANRDGTVHFRRDAGGRDARIAALLQLD
jgi:murein L,D-transpeptidase YcbB/YkuD